MEAGTRPDPDDQRAPEARRLFGVVVGLVVLVALLIAGIAAFGDDEPDAEAGIYTCRGEPATIAGTNDNDVIEGTPERDVIHARGGDDVVRASQGDDIVCGGRGDDELRGGRGEDVIVGGTGTDVCDGGKGTDTFVGCETEEQ